MGAVAQTERDHAEFLRYGDGVDWSFLQNEAARELAKVFVVGQSPDSLELAQLWAASWVSSDSSLLPRLTAVAVAPSATFVAAWEEQIAAQPLFSDGVRDRDACYGAPMRSND